MVGVSGDKIDGDEDDYHDYTESKMWQDSLPHKKPEIGQLQTSIVSSPSSQLEPNELKFDM